MSKLTIGYYAHHHGRGHVQRAKLIAEAIPHPVTVFSSAPNDMAFSSNVSFFRLPLDYDNNTVAESFDHLHYAPLKVKGLRTRARKISKWFDIHWPCLLVVDVSVEIAALARLCSVPVIYVRQRGNRFDLAHELAYASASRLLAPYNKRLEQPGTPEKWQAKTDYVGLISRYGTDPTTTLNQAVTVDQTTQIVSVIVGHGGTAINISMLAEAACACPDWRWVVIGPVTGDKQQDIPPNLELLGIVRDPKSWFAAADVIVGSGGDSLISEIADMKGRFVCIPDKRPFGEQHATAQALHLAGVAISIEVWPSAYHWPAVLQKAVALDPERWTKISDCNGAHRAATAILNVAEAILGRC
jgi:predicted glycosyltransferase